VFAGLTRRRGKLPRHYIIHVPSLKPGGRPTAKPSIVDSGP